MESPAQIVTPDEPPLLEVRDLHTHFSGSSDVGRAVNGVSFELRRGETLGLVGESGSGKSMTALSLLQMNPKPASRIVGGQVLFRGEDLVRKSEREMQVIRGSRIAYVPQDPLTSLNPVLRIGQQMEEPLEIHRGMARRDRKQKVVSLLESVRIPMAAERARSFPHQLSGGMRQRVVSATAISCDPEILIADEPTTALDVTVQADYLDLLRDIQTERQLAIIFITHDFGIVANICDNVAVMYAGRIVEKAPTRRLFSFPSHPYTRALLNSLPDVSKAHRRLPAIPGQPPSIFEPQVGCPFAARCDVVFGRCREERPPFIEIEPGVGAACWRLLEPLSAAASSKPPSAATPTA